MLLAVGRGNVGSAGVLVAVLRLLAEERVRYESGVVDAS